MNKHFSKLKSTQIALLDMQITELEESGKGLNDVVAVFPAAVAYVFLVTVTGTLCVTDERMMKQFKEFEKLAGEIEAKTTLADLLELRRKLVSSEISSIETVNETQSK